MERIGQESNASAGKSTLYYRSDFGAINKVECRSIIVHRRPWAQYDGSVEVIFVQKGKRNARRINEGYRPYFIVLEGWGHTDPDNMFHNHRETADGKAVISEARHSVCSDGWTDDFDTLIERYVSETGAKVVGDWRHVNGYDKAASEPFLAAKKEDATKQLENAGVPSEAAQEAARILVDRSPQMAAAYLYNEHEISAWVDGLYLRLGHDGPTIKPLAIME